jgi:hypothetical protein
MFLFFQSAAPCCDNLRQMEHVPDFAYRGP